MGRMSLEEEGETVRIGVHCMLTVVLHGGSEAWYSFPYAREAFITHWRANDLGVLGKSNRVIQRVPWWRARFEHQLRIPHLRQRRKETPNWYIFGTSNDNGPAEEQAVV